MIKVDIQELEIKEIEKIREQTEERFKIDNLSKANWAFRKLAAIENKENEIKNLATQEVDRIKQWEAGELKHYSGDRDWLEFLLEEYFREEIAKDDKFRCKTPYGSISQRKQQPAYKYDDDLIIERLKELNKEDLVEENLVISVNKSDLKKELEVIENIYLIDGELMEYQIEGDALIVKETGEVIWMDDDRLTYKDAVAALDGNLMDGVIVIPRDPKVNIKVE